MSEIGPNMPEYSKPFVEIERAQPEDAEVICDIRDRAWLETYPNEELGITRDDVLLMAKGPLGEYVPRRIAYLKEQFSKENGFGTGTFVAKIDGKVVGYTDTAKDNGQAEIVSMYVAPEVQGTGAGGALMRHALNVLGRDQNIYLDVIAYNKNAIGFYEHFGFEKTNAIVHDEVGRPAYLKKPPKIVMVLRAA